MKKKRLYATLLIAALLSSSGGKIWGQAGAILSPDGNPNGTVKVNNAFGAGESSIISNGTSATRNILGPNFTLTPYPNPDFSYTGGVAYNRAYTYPLFVSPSLTDIQIGDNGVDGNRPNGNMVIRAYTGQGYALGWISVINRIPNKSTHPNSVPYPTSYPNLSGLDANTQPKRFVKSPDGTPQFKLIEFSFNKNNYTNYEAEKWYKLGIGDHPDLSPALNGVVRSRHGGKDAFAPCGETVFTAVSCIDDPNVPGGYIIKVKQHLMPAGSYAETSSGPAPIPEAVYTSTIDGYFTKSWDPTFFGRIGSTDSTRRNYPTDDGVHLVQLTGSPMQDAAALSTQVSLTSAANNT